MATYADGSTIAEVGDIVKCVAQGGSMFKPLSGDCSYKVVQLSGDSVYLEYPSEHGFLCSRFELIKRTGAATSPAKAEPLVKWPEESHCPDFAHVPCKQLFVVKRFPQSVMYKDSKGAFHVIAGYRPDGLSDTDACRLLRVSTDTSSPFVVI